MSTRVLVCDDALFMRAMIKQILGGGGYEVVAEAENGEDAVEKYQQFEPDLVTMDVVMPGSGGVEAVRHILQLDSRARILVCTAMGHERLVAETLEAGAKNFVVKPFNADQLLEAAERALA